MLNFGASKPRVRGGARAPGAPLDPHLQLAGHVDERTFTLSVTLQWPWSAIRM